MEPHCSPLDFIPALRLEWIRVKQRSSIAGKTQGNLPSPHRHQCVRVPSGNPLSVGKINPAHTIKDTVKGTGNTSRTAALRNSHKVLEISKQMETSAVKPQ